MKRKLSFFLVIVMAFCLCACGSDSKSNTSKSDFVGTWLADVTSEDDSTTHSMRSLILQEDGSGTYLNDGQFSITWDTTTDGIELHYEKDGSSTTEKLSLSGNTLVSSDNAIFRNSNFGSSDTTTDGSTKGMKSNPYKIDELVEFETCLSLDTNKKFNVKLRVVKPSGEQLETGKKVLEKFNKSTDNLMILDFTIASGDGNYSEPLSIGSTSSGGFTVKGVTANGESGNIFWYSETSTTSSVSEVYSDFENVLYGASSDASINYKYLTFEYAVDKYKTETVWVQIAD